ncbi:type II/IV secretion system protein [Falsibacillus albus]|uniref:Type II/IV secretion system protein n=1 Tax=Falsibacillus albus TaxID=2478915 RepID=A0A3L7K7Y5_9BACI|nr:type II/IV secretion system protein [Falsibacillus albus]
MVAKKVESISKGLLRAALEQKATDVHLAPRKEDYFIQFRTNGKLIPFQTLPIEMGERLISHLKFMAQMDISEKRKPQSGSYQISFPGLHASLRISSLPTAYSKESIVIRIHYPNQHVPIEKMTLFPKTLLTLQAFLKHSHGLIIFTGPTGSGKTTTLYSLVQYCSENLNRNVITLEDPIEKQDDKLLQVQVNEKAGVTYSTGLKAILRHDPDIIMVGEIRDAETAKISIRAALTGHLVLTTLHTRDAKGAIYRLLEFGVNWHEIEQTLIAVSAQRLIHLQCPQCKEEREDSCSHKFNKQRASVYELLYGKALLSVLKESRGEKEAYNYPTLKNILRKGIALGYISNEEYNRWIHQEQKADHT